jgi:hypothetical protein|tara:strand:+ start:2140 stop:2841 length:702 start_codon:yes stop_codon:yes gene_type:complete
LFDFIPSVRRLARHDCRDFQLKSLLSRCEIGDSAYMSKLAEFQKHLRPGRSYRRSDLAKWSNAVDRHIQASLADGSLTKVSGGLYCAPKRTAFGNAPVSDESLVSTFLKGDKFLLVSPNAYNSLGVGTTQLHNRTVVYNHKRHGKIKLGGRVFDFWMKHRFPSKLTPEFLLVDLVNNLDQLGEDPGMTLARVERVATASDRARLMRAAKDYGRVRTNKFFTAALAGRQAAYAA